MEILTNFLIGISLSMDAFSVSVIAGSLNDRRKLFNSFKYSFLVLISFLICLTGFYTGNRIKKIFGEKLELIAGIILLLIGFKILLKG
jgi:putative Mn2+ efflux pump MntP